MALTITTGEGSAAEFVAGAAGVFRDALGFTPFPGTLNVYGAPDAISLDERISWESGNHCDGVRFTRCYIGGVRAAAIRPDVPGYPEEKFELLAPVQLREVFDITDGDSLAVHQHPWAPGGYRTRPARLDQFDAIIFDFDGTIAEFTVNWDAVQKSLIELFEPHHEGALAELNPKAMLQLAREYGIEDEVEKLLTAAELEAVPSSRIHDAVSTIVELGCPLGICTANGSGPVRELLEREGATDAFDVVVARDTVQEMKPHPNPLQRCIETLGSRPGDTLFVGDLQTDAETAHRAKTSFLHATDAGIKW